MLILLASVGFGFQIQMDLKNHLRLLYDIRKLLLDIANETAYTMDSMEVVLEHSIHSRNQHLNEICREMGEGLQRKERGCGQELWQERIEAWQKTLGLTSKEKNSSWSWKVSWKSVTEKALTCSKKVTVSTMIPSSPITFMLMKDKPPKSWQ